ncbi:MAG TPA: phosphopentomutase [Firmicutes bacterium]|nr:phosphopentomutase [Clostridiales bacterium]HIY81794.1 phosphopentomutase [Bacillota bacterium]
MEDNRRLFLIVLDSVGIGEAPDAAQFGDEGSNTVRAAVEAGADLPNLRRLGLFNIDGMDWTEPEAAPIGAFGRMREASMGKDTTIGHWEIAGVVSPKPLPTFPDGFPPEIIRNFEKLTGRKVICNKPYSGTQLLLDYGREHVETGALMVYTSADSVFQVAAHEDIVPIEELYHDCELAREMLTGDYAVGRVIARPFVGEYPNYTRTARRHDYSLQPPRATMLNNLEDAGYECIGVGKISDIFAGSGITQQIRTQNNTDGIAKTLDLMENDFEGICFVNLVDFDMVYGHRNDAPGYARALMEFDQALPKFMEQMGEDDLLIITADHGCDPSTPSTDHSREYTPMLAWSKKIRPGANLGTRTTFADIGATVLEYFGLENRTDGQSFLKEICTEK